VEVGLRLLHEPQGVEEEAPRLGQVGHVHRRVDDGRDEVVEARPDPAGRGAAFLEHLHERARVGVAEAGPAQAVVHERLRQRRHAEPGEPLEGRLEVGHGDPEARPAEVVRGPVRDRALRRRRVVEELELHEVLAADEPPEREGRVVAEPLDLAHALPPEHLPARLGEPERLGVELDRARDVGGAEGDLGELGRHLRQPR
jgi:hypothetical protein